LSVGTLGFETEIGFWRVADGAIASLVGEFSAEDEAAFLWLKDSFGREGEIFRFGDPSCPN
jgi:hypothetical protein